MYVYASSPFSLETLTLFVAGRLIGTESYVSNRLERIISQKYDRYSLIVVLFFGSTHKSGRTGNR